jgi:hypothetical protein
MMKRASLFFLIGIVLASSLVSAQAIYRWVDEKGSIHFADDPSLIPEKYRDQTKTEKIPTESPPPASQAQPQVGPTGPPSGKAAAPSSERKDVLGRGEDWWKAQAKMWKEKLQNAQKSYETANAAVQARKFSKTRPMNRRNRWTRQRTCSRLGWSGKPRNIWLILVGSSEAPRPEGGASGK